MHLEYTVRMGGAWETTRACIDNWQGSLSILHQRCVVYMSAQDVIPISFKCKCKIARRFSC